MRGRAQLYFAEEGDERGRWWAGTVIADAQAPAPDDEDAAPADPWIGAGLWERYQVAWDAEARLPGLRDMTCVLQGTLCRVSAQCRQQRFAVGHFASGMDPTSFVIDPCQGEHTQQSSSGS